MRCPHCREKIGRRLRLSFHTSGPFLVIPTVAIMSRDRLALAWWRFRFEVTFE